MDKQRTFYVSSLKRDKDGRILEERPIRDGLSWQTACDTLEEAEEKVDKSDFDGSPR